LEDYDALKRSDLLEYYANFIQNKSFALLISGKLGADEKYIIEQHLGRLDLTEAAVSSPNFQALTGTEKRIKAEKKGATQAALRLGKQTIGKDHTDFPALFFLNTLLGGFFGSRLMTNIREEKGYTYGIGSGLICLREGAYFFIASEIGANYVEETLTEIKNEVNRLCDEKVTEAELNLLKRYLQGSLMRNFDGPFAAMDRFKSLYLLGLNYSYYDQLWEAFNEMTAEKLQQTAQSYLNFEELKIIVAGA
jgi:predicted Zn-dependent peptidase